MFISIIVAVCVILDQISKIMIVKTLSPDKSLSVIYGVLNFTYAENTGAAFSIMQNSRWFFVALTVIILIGVIVYIVKHKPANLILCSGIALAVGGAIGNLIDRIRLGYVVDFLQTVFIEFPIFNLADTFICCGMALIIIYILFLDKDVTNAKNKN